MATATKKATLVCDRIHFGAKSLWGLRGKFAKLERNRLKIDDVVNLDKFF